jgi:ribosome-binding factor A
LAEDRRAERVAEAIRTRFAETLQRELGDPLLSSLVVTQVQVAPDLSYARISVRLLAGDDDPKRRQAALRSLKRAGGRIRRALAPELRLRRFPELAFEYDTGHDATRRVEELLEEIARERGSGDDPGKSPSGDDPGKSPSGDAGA